MSYKIMTYLIVFSVLLLSNCLNAEIAGEVDFRIGELLKRNTELVEWTGLDEGDPVSIGDTLKTGAESRCEIVLEDGSSIRLSEKTIYVIDEYSIATGSVIFKANLIAGEVWTNVFKDDKTSRDFKVKTPIAVAAVIGTIFKSAFSGKESAYTVMEGKVKVDLVQEKKKELKLGSYKGGSLEPTYTSGPEEISGPREVLLEEWVQIVKGEIITVKSNGKYQKSKIDVEVLAKSWEDFKK